MEREPRVALECPRRLRLAVPLRPRERAAAPPPLPARARRLPRGAPPLAGRGRGIPPLGPEARAKLRNPGCAAKPEPDGRQDDVEDHHRDPERAPPHRPVPRGDPALLAEIAADPSCEDAVLRRSGGSRRRRLAAPAPLVDEADDPHRRLLDRELGDVDHRAAETPVDAGAVSSSSKTASRSA